MRLLPLGEFVAGLAAGVAAHRACRVEAVDARRAAVAVVVSESGPAVLFIRRRERAGDPWSGQMAFPGGFQRMPDETALEAARREAREETGLDLSDSRVVGTLDDLHPRAAFLPPIVVTPWVFVVPARVEVAPGAEAEAALWIPVADLFAPEHRTVVTVPFPSDPREFPAIQVGAELIWGLTERILSQVGELVGASGPAVPGFETQPPRGAAPAR